MLRRIFVVAMLVCPTIARADDVSNTVSVAPIGAAFRAFATEYERAVLPRVSAFVEAAWLAGIEPPGTMGERYTGPSLRAGARWFPFGRALHGVFAGLELHGTIGTIDAPDRSLRGRAIGVAPMLGYALVIRDRLDLSFGLGVELNASNLETDPSMDGDALRFQVQPLPRASIGFAF